MIPREDRDGLARCSRMISLCHFNCNNLAGAVAESKRAVDFDESSFLSHFQLFKLYVASHSEELGQFSAPFLCQMLAWLAANEVPLMTASRGPVFSL